MGRNRHEKTAFAGDGQVESKHGEKLQINEGVARTRKGDWQRKECVLAQGKARIPTSPGDVFSCLSWYLRQRKREGAPRCGI